VLGEDGTSCGSTVAANTCSLLPSGSTMIAGGCGLVTAGSLIQLHGEMLARLWTFPSGQFEKSPLNSTVPVLGVVVVVVDVLVEVVLVTGVVVVDVLVEVVLVTGVVVVVVVVDVDVLVEGVVVVVITGVVVVEVDVVVVGGGGLVGLFTTGVGFDVLTDEPFLLLAVTTSRRVKPTSAAASKYVWAVAPVTRAHVVPALEQRAH
jgi:hypothetical protein